VPALMLWLVVAALVTTVTAPVSVQQSVGKLRLELAVNKPVYVAGEPVEVRLTLRNGGESPLRVQFGSGQRFDVIVRRRGALVWRWSYDKAFVQVIQDVTLRPGETLSFGAAWGQVDLQGRRAEPGDYEIIGVFLGRVPDAPGTLETPPLPIRITP